ncbi:MAG: hypothetical protein WBL06_10970 [Pseudolysinimonas sp.]|uniref:hypothetical protein n=1 Tax=Pseudolysinimonas sp. TaxID=2680009 RepID=UPI003C76E9CB
MTLLRIPSPLHDVFGARQRQLAIALVVLAAFGVPLALAVTEPHLLAVVAPWRVVFAALLVADVAAGAVANLTAGTNDHYAERPASRWVFIAVHLHLPAVAVLLDLPIVVALVVWAGTIAGAVTVNLLRGHPEQQVVAGTIFVAIATAAVLLTDARALTLVGILFAFKVVYAFAVDHEGSQ